MVTSKLMLKRAWPQAVINTANIVFKKERSCALYRDIYSGLFTATFLMFMQVVKL